MLLFSLCKSFCYLSYTANGIDDLDNLNDLLKECNSREFKELIPVINRLKLRRKYDDYVGFIFITFNLYILKIKNSNNFYYIT